MLQSEAGYIDARPQLQGSTNPLALHGRTIHQGQKRASALSAECLLSPAADIAPRLHPHAQAPDASNDLAGAPQIVTRWCAIR
jgi:hypothetical protein